MIAKYFKTLKSFKESYFPVVKDLLILRAKCMNFLLGYTHVSKKGPLLNAWSSTFFLSFIPASIAAKYLVEFSVFLA